MIHCIVCGTRARKVRNWSHDDIRKACAAKFPNIPLPPDIDFPDYQILACPQCHLIFANPPVPGNAKFYTWATSTPAYYPVTRWEWTRVIEIMTRRSAKNLLEIGCGRGNFLAYVAETTEVKVVGVDTHAPSVEACRRRGLSAHCSTVEEFTAANSSSKFDVVCAFHCLEHVADPRAFMKAMRSAVSQGGRLIVSVPYSPTSWEIIGWDAFNLPPHHLTRWRATSLQRLAAEIDLRIVVETDGSSAGDEIWRSSYWRLLSTTGEARGGFSDYFSVVVHPILLFRSLWFTIRRDRVGSTLAGDIALAVLEV